jgi:hypothetical protein
MTQQDLFCVEWQSDTTKVMIMIIVPMLMMVWYTLMDQNSLERSYFVSHLKSLKFNSLKTMDPVSQA